jgi:hypothetical protein
MDENILTRLALDESVSLAGVEPFHCALFFHFSVTSLWIKLFARWFASSPQNKRLLGTFCLAASVLRQKQTQEQQTQHKRSIHLAQIQWLNWLARAHARAQRCLGRFHLRPWLPARGGV